MSVCPRMPRAMAQFVLKIANLVNYMGTTCNSDLQSPSLAMAPVNNQKDYKRRSMDESGI